MALVGKSDLPDRPGGDHSLCFVTCLVDCGSVARESDQIDTQLGLFDNAQQEAVV